MATKEQEGVPRRESLPFRRVRARTVAMLRYNIASGLYNFGSVYIMGSPVFLAIL